jgi:hypothetical protein
VKLQDLKDESAAKGGLLTAGIQPALREPRFTPIIMKVNTLCGFPDDSMMVRYIYQQGWKDLEHVTTIGIGEVKDFFTVEPDGNFEAKPMLVHLRMFKAFLPFITQKRRESFFKMTEGLSSWLLKESLINTWNQISISLISQ